MWGVLLYVRLPLNLPLNELVRLEVMQLLESGSVPELLNFSNMLLSHGFNAQLPLNEPGCLEVVEMIESEILCRLPWVTSDNFISCIHEGRIALEVADRRGDPTGA